MRVALLSVAAAGLFLASCSSEPPVEAKKGEKFTFDGKEMTVDFKASTVLVNEKEGETLIAPEGQIYLTVDISGNNPNFFSSLKDGEKELEAVDYLWAKPFLRAVDLMKGTDKSDLYLVDLNNANYTVEIKSYGDATATVKVGALKDEATVKINPKMIAFTKEFAEGGRVLEAAKKYVKSGVNVLDIATEGGEVPFGDPITKGMTIKSISNGTYTCSTELGHDKVEITWEGDYITKIVME